MKNKLKAKRQHLPKKKKISTIKPSTKKKVGESLPLSQKTVINDQKGFSSSDIASLATCAWRIKKRLLDKKTYEPVASIDSFIVKKELRDLEEIAEILNRYGINIVDRTHQPFHNGLPEKVVLAKPLPNLQKENVVETFHPTIFWNDCLIQRGEVSIEVPENPSAEKEVAS